MTEIILEEMRLPVYSVTQTKDTAFVISGRNGGVAVLFGINKIGEVQWIKIFKTELSRNFF